MFWLCLFILSGVVSLLISSSILGTYQPGEFIFQCPIFLPFHTVHGVLKARILKWFAIPFSSGPRFVRTLHHDPSVLGGPTCMAHSFIELDKAVVHVIRLQCYLITYDSSVGKESACNAGDPSLIPGSGRSAGEGIGYPLQYSWSFLVWFSW